MSNTHYIIRCN